MSKCKVCEVELVASEEAEGICYVCKNKTESERQATVSQRESPDHAESNAVVKPKTIVKNYTGKKEEAAYKFEADAKEMAKENYYPISQSYAPGTWGCGAFIIAVILCIVLIGVLALIYMLIVKPDGTLTVTYEYRGEQAASEPPAGTPPGEKICPQCAETVKAAAKICRYCRYEFESQGGEA